MLELIERCEHGLKERLCEIVNYLHPQNLTSTIRASYIHDLENVCTLAPILYPGKILNAAVNFSNQVKDSGTEEQWAATRRQLRENRGVP